MKYLENKSIFYKISFNKNTIHKWIRYILCFLIISGALISCLPCKKASAIEFWNLQTTSKILYLDEYGNQCSESVYDFNFVDAPKGYTSAYTFKWTSNNTQIATVQSGGIVTAEREGKTSIVCQITSKKTGQIAAMTAVEITVMRISHASRILIYEAGDINYVQVTAKTIPIGKTVDLNRMLFNSKGEGSAAGHATNTVSSDYTGWNSTNPAVATIDKNGVVTAHRTGTTSVYAYTYKSSTDRTPLVYSDYVTIVVTDKQDISVSQKGADTFSISGISDFNPSRLSVYEVTPYGSTASMVVKSTSVGSDGTVTVQTYYNMSNGMTYRVYYDGMLASFTASVGSASRLQLFTDLNADGSTTETGSYAYIANYDITNITSKFIVKIYDSSGVDVTSKYENSYDVDVEIDDYYYGRGIYSNGMDIIVDETVTPGTSAKFNYNYNIYQNGVLLTSGSGSIVVHMIEQNYGSTLKYVDASFVYSDGSPLVYPEKQTLTIALDDEIIGERVPGYSNYLMIRVKDGQGNFLYNGYNDSGYTITFTSLDTNKLLIDSLTGEIKTISTGTARVLASVLAPPNANGKQKATQLAVISVKITSARQAASLKVIEGGSKTISKVSYTELLDYMVIESKVASVGDLYYDGTDTCISQRLQEKPDDFDKVTVRIQITDSQGAPYDPYGLGVITVKAKASISSSSQSQGYGVAAGKSEIVFNYTGADGIYKYTFNSSDFITPSSCIKQGFVYKVSVDDNTKLSGQFTINVANPLKTTSSSYIVEATDVDVYKGFSEASDIASEITMYESRNGVKMFKIKLTAMPAVTADRTENGFYYTVTRNGISVVETYDDGDDSKFRISTENYISAVSPNAIEASNGADAGSEVYLADYKEGQYTVKVFKGKKSVYSAMTTFDVTCSAGKITYTKQQSFITTYVTNPKEALDAFRDCYTVSYDGSEVSKAWTDAAGNDLGLVIEIRYTANSFYFNVSYLNVYIRAKDGNYYIPLGKYMVGSTFNIYRN